MHSATVACPIQGTEAYFSFKEPMAQSIQARLGVSSSQILLKVSAINEIREMLQSELRDPFLEAYAPANIEQSQYKQDLLDNLSIITFKFTAPSGAVKYVRVPLSLINDYASTAEIPYFIKSLVVDLGPQHQDLDLTVLHTDLRDFIKSRTGIDATVKEVSLGDAVKLTVQDHQAREAIRQGGITVTKTLAVQLQETQTLYQGLVDRLNTMGISLG